MATGSESRTATVRRRLGVNGRDAILDAAAHLFTTLGFAGTSTRAIADAVGIRQASLYHHFKTKDELACALLNQTVTPTLDLIPYLLRVTPALTPAGHLHALATFDGDRLLNRRWNLGTLYLQPELRSPGLAPFWSGHDRLRWHYLTISQSIAAETEIHQAATELPFRIVESLVSMWATEPGEYRNALPAEFADACLRVLRVPEESIRGCRDTTHALLQSYSGAGRSG
ncbi:MAG: TetR/AcrR family transcriptional regulator [Mycobacterium sp.]